jgi:4-amino-4-deoxy-L-arabinose transferase-like glycosyltransferase
MSDGEKRQLDSVRWGYRNRVAVLTLPLVLTAPAFILRVWKLNSLPPWLFSDESAYRLDVRDILQGGFRVFFPRNLGRQPLYNYLAVPFEALTDGTPIAIRLGAADMGVATVPVLFTTGKTLWKERPRMVVRALHPSGLKAERWRQGG